MSQYRNAVASGHWCDGELQRQLESKLQCSPDATALLTSLDTVHRLMGSQMQTDRTTFDTVLKPRWG